MSYRLLYFASLADAAGVASETVDLVAADPATLYAHLSERHRFPMSRERLRVAVNGALVGWDHALADGDEIVFLPPVSGG